MRSILILIFGLSSFLSFAQTEEVELAVGDTLYFGVCDGEAYSYIDLYVKTRFEKDSISYDTLNNWEFYNRFFGSGDFDVTRLPCSYKNSYGIIKHMMSVQNKDGEWMNVVIAMIEDGKSAAYIVEDAFLNEEVLASPSP